MHAGAWPEKTYTEEDWHAETYEVTKTADGATVNCASKTSAFVAAFDYVKDVNPPFSIATICQPMVCGPSSMELHLPQSLILRLWISTDW